MGASRPLAYYEREKEGFLDAFEAMSDMRSREIYADIFALRVAPQLAEHSYEELCTLPQYFPEDVYMLGDREIVADCGAYTGDTFEEFYRLTGGSFRGYHAFEMDRENYHRLLVHVGELCGGPDERVACHPYGGWSEDKELSYGRMSSADSYSIFNGSETEKARVVGLDRYLTDTPVTLIKMDIEGSEQEALKGCKELIDRHHPKMAICVYHRVEDLWQIPLYLKSLNPSYRLYLRHHAKWWVSETVCYAII